MDRRKKLIKRAIEVRDAARAAGNLERSNAINRILYLVTKAGDHSPASLGKLEKEVGA